MRKIIISLPQFDKIHETKEPGFIINELSAAGFSMVLASSNKYKYKEYENIKTEDIVTYCNKNSVSCVISIHISDLTKNIFQGLDNSVIKVIKVDGGGFLPSYRSEKIGGGLRSAIHWLASPLVNKRNFDIAKKCVNLSDLILIESNRAALNLYASLNLSDDVISKLRVCRNPVREKTNPSISDADRNIIAVGRYDDQSQKRLGRLIKSYQIYRKKILNPWPLHIVGPFPDEYVKYGDQNIIFHGPRPPEKVLEVIKKCRILISSSEWEGFPNTFNEALMSGLTIVSTPVPAAIDAVMGGLAGSVSNHFSAKSLAGALILEHQMWETGMRIPLQVSNMWKSNLEIHDITRILENEIRRREG